MQAGVQFWVCKTCNCTKGFVQMSSTASQILWQPAWQAGNSVNGATRLSAFDTKEACLVLCKGRLASQPNGGNVCCAQSNGCYIGTSMHMAPRTDMSLFALEMTATPSPTDTPSATQTYPGERKGMAI